MRRPEPARCDDVIFDCDSTLCAIEGIDVLADWQGLGPRVAALTDAAMNGTLPLEAVYGERLALLRPGREALARLGEAYIAHALPTARAVVAALTAAGHRVFIVSGGLLEAVRPFALWLGVPAARVRAVALSFDAAGAYAGFDAASPLATQTGKTRVIAALRRPGRRAMLIGDGASDLAAAGAVDVFVGFGGVVHRPAVERSSSIYLRSNSLWPIVALAAG